MIDIRTFSGEFPRIPKHLLPDNAAQYANNCDFAHGELRSLKQVSLLQTMVSAVLGLWTEDGLNFLTWPYDVDAVRGPVIDDQYKRLYYSTGDASSGKGFRVTQRTQAAPTGGPPASSWYAGVPAPANAPTVVATNATVLPDNVTLAWKFFYEANGVKYQEQPITPTVVQLGREYTFTAPLIQTVDLAAPGDSPATDTIVSKVPDALKATPENAIPCVQVIGTDATTNTQKFMAYSANSSFVNDGDTTDYNGLAIALSAQPGGAVTVKFTFGAGFQQTRAYVYTAVNLWSEESAPSMPVTLTHDGMQVPRLTLPPIVDTGYVPITRYRIYGTVSSSSGATDYQLIGETNSASSDVTYDVASKPATWGALLGTIGHLPPKADLKCLTALPNGMLAAIRANEIWFCEPYKPWAWNPENAITLPYGAIGAKAAGRSLIVTTSAYPYIVTGLLPESMSETRIDAVQAGVSKHAICDCGGFVVYASNDGLVTIDGGQASLSMGQRFFTREDWRARYGSVLGSLRLAFYDGCLILYGGGTPLVIRFDEAQGSLTEYSYLSASAHFMLPQTDSLYVAVATGVYQFGAGGALSKTWTSKEFTLPKPSNLGALQVLGSGANDVEVFADGTSVFSQTVSNGVAYRLPGGFKARRWHVTITGTGIVEQLHLATTKAALANV